MNVAIFLEIRNEYTEHLVDAISPYIYEGLMTIYHQAVQAANETNSTEKTLLIFQRLLQTVNDWNQKRIEDETNRIKQASGTNEYLDDLVKAVVRSNIILLTYPNFNQYLAHTFMNTITTATFIHCCYIECSKTAHNFPNLFYHNVEPMDQKRNQMSIQNNIQDSIIRSIRKILPIHAILKEYLVNSSHLMCDPYGVELIGGQKVRENPRLTPANPVVVPVQENFRQFREPSLTNRNRIESHHHTATAQYLQKPLTDRNPKDTQDRELDRAVENIIRSENNKRDQVKDLLRMDKVLSATGGNRVENVMNNEDGRRMSERNGRDNRKQYDNNRVNDHNEKRLSEKKISEKRLSEKRLSEKGGSLEIDMSKNIPEYGVPRFQNQNRGPQMFTGFKPLERNVLNAKQSERVSDFMNRNLDETDKALFDLKLDSLDDYQTTHQAEIADNRGVPYNDNITSEKPDPSRVTIIEDYGTKNSNPAAKNRRTNRA